ncbi:putative glycosyltransferase EpsJ [Microbacterium oxydans]|uniref:Putative glycosyltransferase EpsJ n=1 Tax=Microbacterium oxydans TaxID=82380 RepID=A0A0F0L5A4_9MICO|nr:glycosyltransferase family A protein [Microbacterium oxydans]KJL27869.1 putative glycosyltransferase EpsJ [Microbacterium oxydans]CAH0149446.1 putative glycosyltransferase EpsJ [Microbacterium oxydans]
MPVRVSVVVPVFNPGPTFDELIESFDQQTLSKTDFEVLLCDDGSDESTQRRLADVARSRDFIHVMNLPHSGWPGTPRNHGIAEARGTYVQFVDQDDRLFPGALEHLCDYADRHSSDVIIGKEVGIGRSLPRQIFSRDIAHAQLGKDPILEMLTPHKMFRTSFLRDNDIHFPNGRVRLEDHLFVMEAYFKATTISVLASEPCYAWVKEPGSASSQRIEPETYFPHLEAVLDLVEANTEPGKLRDRLLRHWLRGKILKRLTGTQMLRYPQEYRARFLDVVEPLVQRRFGPGVDAGLTFPNRIRAALLRADRRDDLLRLAEFETGIDCRATVTSAAWSRGGGLHLTIRVSTTSDGADALVFETTGAEPKQQLWQAPAWLSDLPPAVLDATRELRSDTAELVVEDPQSGLAHRFAGRRGPGGAESVRVAIDPLKIFGEAGHSPRATLAVRVRRAGWSFEVPLTADPSVLARAGTSPLLAGRDCRLVAGADGAVTMRREGPAGGLRDLAGRAARRARALARRR